jgi:hypothetical protein
VVCEEVATTTKVEAVIIKIEVVIIKIEVEEEIITSKPELHGLSKEMKSRIQFLDKRQIH